MLAHHLKLKVIAEGVETWGQRAYLEQFGCEYAQGFLYSPPVEAQELEKLLALSFLDHAEVVAPTTDQRAPAK